MEFDDDDIPLPPNAPAKGTPQYAVYVKAFREALGKGDPSASKPTKKKRQKAAPVEPAASEPAPTSTTSRPASAAASASRPTTAVTSWAREKASSKTTTDPLISTSRIRETMHTIDPRARLDNDASAMLADLLSSFIGTTMTQAARLCTHRGSTVLEVADAALPLRLHHGIEVPGYGTEPRDARVGVMLRTKLHREMAGVARSHVVEGVVNGRVGKRGRKSKKAQ